MSRPRTLGADSPGGGKGKPLQGSDTFHGRRNFFLTIRDIAFGVMLGRPQTAAAYGSPKCVCGRSQFRPFEFGTQKILVCTRCGLMFMDRYKQSDPAPG